MNNLLFTKALVIAAAASCLSLGACATTAEPVIRTVTVKVPVREACVPPDVPPPPQAYADEHAAAKSPDERYLATARANLERKARLARIEPVIAGCR